MRLGVKLNGIADYRSVLKQSRRGKLRAAKILKTEDVNIYHKSNK